MTRLRPMGIALALAWCPPLLAAEDRPTFHASVEIASQVAASDDELVLVVFGAPWCPFCKKLKETTLASAHFFDNAGVLRIAEVDIESDPSTARAFKVLTVPTLLLLSADGKIVARRSGFLDDAELLVWVKEGRDRAERGQWEGGEQPQVDPGQLLDAKGIETLIGQLADPNPATRGAAARALFDHRERAMPSLIQALGDPYLGTRIAASELLMKLAPEHAVIDPWRSPLDLAPEIEALRKWWEATLVLPKTEPVLGRAELASIESALESVRTGGGLARTEGMSTLLTHGRSALPRLREAIKRADREDQPQVLALLEDVRWAILIPENLERQCGGARRALARGASSERQAAAARLAQAGAVAIEPLSELVNDNDPLVVEAAVNALSTVGGAAAVPALAALLKAHDANLRMVAAQALGRGKQTAATPHLLHVLADENEMVACTALTALEEIHGTDALMGGEPQPLGPETVESLRAALQDSRWRVRATAAEVAGKVRATDLTHSLQELLDDGDGFVVKNTIVALAALGSKPDPARLLTLARRLPSLRGDAIQAVAESPSPEAVLGVTTLYGELEGQERVSILEALAPKTKYGRAAVSDGWEPLLARAAAEADVHPRRTAAELLGSCSSNVVVNRAGSLLADPDEPTRAAAANAILGVLSGQASRSALDPVARSLMRLRSLAQRGPAASGGLSDETKAQWRSNLVGHAHGKIDPRVALAIYVLGDAHADLPFLAAGTSELTSDQAEWFSLTPAVPAMLAKLPWPGGEPILESLCRWPALAARLAAESKQAGQEAGAFLRDPDRLKGSLEPATGEGLTRALSLLLAEQGGDWSLLAADEETRGVRSALLRSTNAGWRAAALFAMRKDEPHQHLSLFQESLADPSAAVRQEAVKGLRAAISDREVLEATLGPLVNEPGEVGSVAALALLEDEVLEQSTLMYHFSQFQYGGAHAYTSYSEPSGRILVPLPAKPPFLDAARARLGGADATAFAMLLAQYGDFSGVEQLVQRHEREQDEVVFAAIALSRDPGYVPFLRRLAARMSEYELMTILRTLRLMEGPEARALRIEINRRSRQMSSY